MLTTAKLPLLTKCFIKAVFFVITRRLPKGLWIPTIWKESAESQFFQRTHLFIIRTQKLILLILPVTRISAARLSVFLLWLTAFYCLLTPLRDVCRKQGLSLKRLSAYIKSHWWLLIRLTARAQDPRRLLTRFSTCLLSWAPMMSK